MTAKVQHRSCSCPDFGEYKELATVEDSVTTTIWRTQRSESGLRVQTPLEDVLFAGMSEADTLVTGSDQQTSASGVDLSQSLVINAIQQRVLAFDPSDAMTEAMPLVPTADQQTSTLSMDAPQSMESLDFDLLEVGGGPISAITDELPSSSHDITPLMRDIMWLEFQARLEALKHPGSAFAGDF